jgi:methyl-accepting chemotaxis protein
LLLESRRAEKDFLLRNDVKYVMRHDELRDAIGRDLDDLRTEIENLGENGLAIQIDNIRNGFRAYSDGFATLAEAKRRLGLDADSGLEGQLRESVHAIETQLDEFEQPALITTMLMMRRHEKDFMLQRDAKYGDDMKNA